MKSYYQEILYHFHDNVGFSEAVVSNKPLVYYYLTHILIQNSTTFNNIEIKEGKEKADQLLIIMFIVFRRNVKHGKITIICDRHVVSVGNNGIKNLVELKDYLVNLFFLIFETSPMNPSYLQSQEFEKKLIQGREFQKLYECKNAVIHTLHGFGCLFAEEKEEIFNESLLVFWKKLVNGEIGIYFSGNKKNLDSYRVFNRKYYQSSKLNTFLTGISANLFRNRMRTSEYNLFKNSTSEIPELIDPGMFNTELDYPILTLFLYYRNFIEKRKIRSLISMLQYDCNLEDKEVRMLTGLNNTRFHSCRLRNHFHQWYYENVNRIPELLDTAHVYFLKRESMKEKLNEKIRMIDLFQRNVLKTVDLEIFTEEFRSMTEFSRNHMIFKYVFYFASAGKLSALNGIPDEKLMKTLMEIYKKELFNLQEYQAILILLYYVSNEPCEIIITLLKNICAEWSGPYQYPTQLNKMALQLLEPFHKDHNSLTNLIYKTNGCLFQSFSSEKIFLNAIHNIEQE